MARLASGKRAQRFHLARRRWTASLCLALLATGVFCHPLVYAVVAGSDYVAISNESLAYRYGHALRLSEGERFLWLPQGYTLGLMQRGIYYLVRPARSDATSDHAAAPPRVSAMELRDSLNRFSVGTGMLAAVLVFAMFLACVLDRRLSISEKTWCWLTLLLSQHAFAGAGLFYSLAPDYYQLNIVLVSASVYLFLRGVHRTERHSGIPTILGQAMFVGAAAANKISMLPVASLVLLPSLLACSRSFGRLIFTLGVSMVGVISTFAVIHLAYFNFDVESIARVLPSWLGYVVNPGGEAGFFEATLEARMLSHNYAIASAFFCVALVVACISIALGRTKAPPQNSLGTGGAANWRGMALLSLPVFLGIGVVAAWAVWRRPAESTLFESASILLGLGCALVGLSGRASVRSRHLGWGLAAGWIGLTLVTVNLEGFYHSLRQAREHGDQSWAFYEEVTSRGKPVIALIEDDRFAPWSVEKLLLKAFSDPPTWDINEGRSSLDHFTSMRFRTLQSRDRIDAPYPNGVLLAQFRLGDGESNAPVYAELDEARTRPGVTCERWVFDEGHSAQLCDIPEREEAAVGE